MPLTDIPVLPMNKDITSYIQYFHEVDENLVIKIKVEQLHNNKVTKVAYLVRTSPMKHLLNLQRLSKSLNREVRVQERSGSRITELINEEDEATTSYNIMHPTNNNKYRQLEKLVRIVYLYVHYNMYETIVIIIIISSTVLSSLLLYSINYYMRKDDRIQEAVQMHGDKDWVSIADDVGHGISSERCLKRWLCHIKPRLMEAKMLTSKSSNKQTWLPSSC